jgi:PhoH-like ATPase
MKKTYILDTNVLLSDPNAIFSFADNNVVLPFTVLNELDKFKTRQDELGGNAREVSRKLVGLLKNNKSNFKKGIKLPGGGTLKMVPATNKNALPEELQSDKNDNIILSVCLGIKDAILVTNDFVMRLTAESCGVATEDYKKWANAADNADTLYKGFREIKVSKEQLADLWHCSHLEGNLEDLVADLAPNRLPNEFIIFKNTEKSKPFVVRSLASGVRVVPEEYELTKLKPRNLEQKLALDLLMDPKINLVSAIGKAGTGKTLCVLAAGLEQVLEKRKYKSLIVLRPVQPVGKDIGFLPGTKEEKLEPWVAPIKDNLRFLLTADDGRKSKTAENSLNYYFEKGIIEVEAITFIRGRSIADAYIIIDEAQNLSAHELKTIITRVGTGTKIVLTGDIEQIDNMSVDAISNGLSIAIEKFKDHPIAGHITLLKGERSELATLAADRL